MPEEIVGKVVDCIARPSVAGIELTAALIIGDKIHIGGHTTEIKLTVDSMQIDNVNVGAGKAGDFIWVKVSGRVRAGDMVYKIVAEG